MALRSATPYVRTQLAKRLALRAAPELIFSYDDAPEQAARVDAILRQIAADRADPAPADPAPASPVVPPTDA